MLQHIHYWYVEHNDIIISHIIFCYYILLLFPTGALKASLELFVRGTWEHGFKYAQQYRFILTDIIDPSLKSVSIYESFMQITDITLFLLWYCMLHGNIFTFLNALPIKEQTNLETMSNRILCNSNSLKDTYLNA